MKRTLLISTSALVLAAGPVEAQDNLFQYGDTYISGSAGWSMMGETEASSGILSGDFDDTINLSVALGREMARNVRGELEVQYQKSDTDSGFIDGDLDTWGFFANGYYDFDMNTMVEPYVMAGLGANIHDAEFNVADDSDFNFAWQAGAGVNFDVTEQTQLFGGYRYQTSTDVEVGATDVDYERHELLVGLRYYM